MKESAFPFPAGQSSKQKNSTAAKSEAHSPPISKSLESLLYDLARKLSETGLSGVFKPLTSPGLSHGLIAYCVYKNDVQHLNDPECLEALMSFHSPRSEAHAEAIFKIHQDTIEDAFGYFGVENVEEARRQNILSPMASYLVAKKELSEFFEVWASTKNVRLTANSKRNKSTKAINCFLQLSGNRWPYEDILNLAFLVSSKCLGDAAPFYIGKSNLMKMWGKHFVEGVHRADLEKSVFSLGLEGTIDGLIIKAS